MTTYACPKGHQSSTDDFCDTCGAKIGGAAASVPAASSGSAPGGSAPGGFAPSGGSAGSGSPGSPGAAAGGAPGTAPAGFPGIPGGAGSPAAPVVGTPAAGPGGVEICPVCGTPRTGTWRFCEDCGYDHTTGAVPTLEPARPGPPTGQWTATVGPDRAYFDANAIEGVEFPTGVTSRTVDLPAPQVRIGRRSRSKGTDPELDLSAEPSDPGVSHSHALLTLNIDGVWMLSDLGSTNGTYVNDEPKPLSAGQSRTVGDGDRVHVGAWTTITLHAPA